MAGNILSQIDGEGNTTQYQYDKVSRLTAVTDAMGSKTRYTYDQRDNLTKVTDALGRNTTYSYDLVDRLIKETDPLGNSLTHTHSLEGNLLTTQKADGSLLSYGYDKSGNLLRQKANGEEILSTTYNETGKLVTTKTQGKEIAYQYNGEGYLTQVDHGNGESTAYEYDNLGRKTTMTYPSGDKVTYTYDTMDRLLTATEMDGSITTYSYDGLGRRIQTSIDNLTTDYAFDEVGNLTAQTTTGDTALALAYKYNRNGQIVEETRKENSATVVSSYSYDPLSQLTAFTNTNGYGEAYTYDKVGNMTKKAISKKDLLNEESTTTLTMAYNKGNQLTSMKNGREVLTYTYDKNGNLSQKQLGKQVDTYSYNPLDQLTGYEGYDGFTQNYTLDSYGLRVSQTQQGNPNRLTLEEMLQGKTLLDGENNIGVEKGTDSTENNGDKKESSLKVTTDFLYDYTLPYGQLIQEKTTQGNTTSITQYTYGLERISAINSSNQTKTQYVYDGRTSVAQTVTKQIGSKVTGPAPQTGAGVRANTATTTQGNTLANTNNIPQIASFTYTPFGEQLGKVGSEKVTDFGFNGEYYDGATGMLNLRARQYEPTMNRFSQKDLLRGNTLHPLSQNRYGFVWNNPLSLIDSTGLAATSSSMYGQYYQAKKVTDNLDRLIYEMSASGTKSSVNAYTKAYKSAQNQVGKKGSVITTQMLSKYKDFHKQAQNRLKEKASAGNNDRIVVANKKDDFWVACAQYTINNFWENSTQFYTRQKMRDDGYESWWQNPNLQAKAFEALLLEAQLNGGRIKITDVMAEIPPNFNFAVETSPKLSAIFLLIGYGQPQLLKNANLENLRTDQISIFEAHGLLNNVKTAKELDALIGILTVEQIAILGQAYLETEHNYSISNAISLDTFEDFMNTMLLLVVRSTTTPAGNDTTTPAGNNSNEESSNEKNWKVVDTESAEGANKSMGEKYSPPYKPGTQTQIIELNQDTKAGEFVRVYDGINSGQAGGWIMKGEDIRGLTPEQIQNKFALPSVPTHVTDVVLKSGTQLRTGVANELFGFEGGGIQFDLMGQRVGEFVNGRPLQ